MTNSLITKEDLHKIVSDAKGNMANFCLPLHISGYLVEGGELTTLAMLESIVMHLNSRNLLVELVIVDYTDPSTEHDPEPPLEPEE
jgi:hypothetical protein